MSGRSTFDEDLIARPLGDLDRSSRVAFAAACGERLWPLVERYAAAVSLPPDRLRSLRDGLDTVWDVCASPGGSRPDAERLLQAVADTAEELYPDEDEDGWVTESGWAQNGIGAILYAARAGLTDDLRQCIWAAYQVYEAADHAAQDSIIGDLTVLPADAGQQLLRAAVVQVALRAIYDDVAAVSRIAPAALQQRVQAEAEVLASLFPRPPDPGGVVTRGR